MYIGTACDACRSLHCASSFERKGGRDCPLTELGTCRGAGVSIVEGGLKRAVEGARYLDQYKGFVLQRFPQALEQAMAGGSRRIVENVFGYCNSSMRVHAFERTHKLCGITHKHTHTHTRTHTHTHTHTRPQIWAHTCMSLSSIAPTM
jgi:hypothetical protein